MLLNNKMQCFILGPEYKKGVECIFQFHRFITYIETPAGLHGNELLSVFSSKNQYPKLRIPAEY